MSLDDITHGIANGGIDLEDVNKALINGIKLYYGVQELCFSRGFKLPLATLGLSQNPYPALKRNGSSLQIKKANDIVLIYPHFPSGNTWIFSHHIKPENHTEVSDPNILSHVLNDFKNARQSVYFTDTDKEYDNLSDFKHDFLALKLSGLK